LLKALVCGDSDHDDDDDDYDDDDMINNECGDDEYD
jgi:hypothetical protein